MYLKHYVGVYCQLRRHFLYKITLIIWYINKQVTSSFKPVAMWTVKYEVMLHSVYRVYMHVVRINVYASKYVYIDG